MENLNHLAIEILEYDQEKINDLFLRLYKEGLTTKDFLDILQKFFGNNMSYSHVNILVENFYELRTTLENSTLEKRYKVVYCDAIDIVVKRDNSDVKESVHVMCGVRDDNKRELLDLYINPTDFSSSWANSLKKLKNRNVETVDLFVSEGLSHIENEIHKCFASSKFQNVWFEK